MDRRSFPSTSNEFFESEELDRDAVVATNATTAADGNIDDFISPSCVVPIAMMLRQALIDLSMARQSVEGRGTKMEMVYEYLTGPQFRQRIQAIVEAFSAMQEDLNQEKKAFARQWAKREVQIESVIGSTAGLYGDLQGIAGRRWGRFRDWGLPGCWR